MKLVVAWLNPDDDLNHKIDVVDYTHCSARNNLVSYSTIDHFAMSERLFAAVTEAGVIHSGQNMSSHAPIYCKITVESLDQTLETKTPHVRSCWVKASDTAKNEFKSSLAEKLNALRMPSCIH